MVQPLDDLIDVLIQQLVAEYLAQHDPANSPLLYCEHQRSEHTHRRLGERTLRLTPERGSR